MEAPVSSTSPDDPYGQGGGYGPAPQYGYQPYQQPLGAGMATTGMVLGIVGIVLCWTAFGGMLLGLLALVFGIIGLQRVRRGEGSGRGRAITGIVTGALGLVLGVVFLFVWLAVFRSSGFTDYVTCVRNAGQDQAKVQQCADQFRDRTLPGAPTS
jgi:hypothetical protein